MQTLLPRSLIASLSLHLVGDSQVIMAKMRVCRLVLIAWSFLLPQFLVNGQCYYPNGDLSSDGDIPCSSNGDGPCCPLNWTCLSNGLCHLENEGYLGRYTCTDQSWRSSSCPNICTHGAHAEYSIAIYS